MKLSEVMKKATDLPWIIDPSEEFTLAVITDAPDGDGAGICEVGLVGERRDKPTDSPTAMERWANAALIVHWSKHGPKLLEALKKAFSQQILVDMDYYAETLANAGEVEGI